jgi:hypothetical protein
MLYRFVLGSKQWNQLSIPATILAGSHYPQQHITEVTVMTHQCVPFRTHSSAAGKSDDNKLSSIPIYL